METVVRDYITRESNTNPDSPPVKDDTELIDSGIIDSLSMLDLVRFIEDKFAVKVPPVDVVPKNFGTVGAICNYVRNRQKEQGDSRL